MMADGVSSDRLKEETLAIGYKRCVDSGDSGLLFLILSAHRLSVHCQSRDRTSFPKNVVADDSHCVRHPVKSRRPCPSGKATPNADPLPDHDRMRSNKTPGQSPVCEIGVSVSNWSWSAILA